MDTFEIWYANTKSLEQITIKRDTVLEVYETDNKVRVLEYTHVPYNVFKDITQCYYVELMFKYSEENKLAVDKYNGTMEFAPYYENGIMRAKFYKLQDAYYFAKNEKDRFLSEFKSTLK